MGLPPRDEEESQSCGTVQELSAETPWLKQLSTSFEVGEPFVYSVEDGSYLPSTLLKSTNIPTLKFGAVPGASTTSRWIGGRNRLDTRGKEALFARHDTAVIGSTLQVPMTIMKHSRSLRKQ